MRNLNFKKQLPLLVISALVCMSYSTASLLSNPNCPTNYTGAPKATTPSLGQVRYCTSCHGDFSMNPAGGGLVVSGLPVSKYNPGQVYNFTVRINHATANRRVWGFAIKAVNTVDNKTVGTFASTNAAATVKGSAASFTTELSHANAPVTANAANYTFMNLSWTAPAVPSTNETNIRFYVTGNAGDNDGGEAGDYIYTSTVDASLSTLPLTLASFTLNETKGAEVTIQWQTLQELNTASFDVETGIDGSNWNKLTTVNAAGTSASARNYSVTDKRPGLNTNVYYRLKMIDQDGTYTYSSVKTIRLKNGGIVIRNLSAQPIQKGQQAVFEVNSNAGRSLSISVFDRTGATISRKNTMVSAGANRIEMAISANEAVSGMYFVKFTADGFEKVIKQIVN